MAFARAKCPSCNRYFKVIVGEGSDEPISACPHCGHRGHDCWHTPEQIEYAKAVAMSTVVAPEIDKLNRQLTGAASRFLKASVKNPISRPPPPPMEVDEAYDIVRFRCCNETVKLHRLENNFCIICSTPYEMKNSNSKRIFLSHKGVDKAQVINFKQTLEGLGFSPWLDEDAMPAGTSLERGILKGMEDSCAVVFFITPSFKDEGFLESEINYAIQQKREKGDRFAIIPGASRLRRGRYTAPRKPWTPRRPSVKLRRVCRPNPKTNDQQSSLPPDMRRAIRDRMRNSPTCRMAGRWRENRLGGRCLVQPGDRPLYQTRINHRDADYSRRLRRVLRQDAAA